MRRTLPPVTFALIVAASALAAQNTRGAVSQAGKAAPTANHDDTKRGMTVADYAKWRSIRDVAISDDGAWASFAYTQRNVDDTLFIKNLNGGGEQKIVRGNRPQFSDDS